MRNPDKWIWPIQLALMIGVAFAALVFHFREPGRLPTEQDYQSAAAYLSQNARPGDAVLLFPWWTERARLFVPESIPVVGYLDSDHDDLMRHPRIWLLAQPRLPRTDVGTFEERFVPGRRKLGETQHFGTLELTLFENQRSRPVLFSAPQALAQEGNAQVRSEWHEVFYEPRRCLYMHPPGGESAQVVELPAVPRGESLLFEAGVIWEHAMKTKGITPTHVILENAASGKPLAELTLEPGQEGFQRARLQGASLPAEAGLRIKVWSRAAEDRDLCVDLTVFGGAPAGSGS